MVQLAILIITCFYIIGIFYRNCVVRIRDYKKEIGYTETIEYINRIKIEIGVLKWFICTVW